MNFFSIVSISFFLSKTFYYHFYWQIESLRGDDAFRILVSDFRYNSLLVFTARSARGTEDAEMFNYSFAVERSTNENQSACGAIGEPHFSQRQPLEQHRDPPSQEL
jgi:hypothetical protein